MPISTIGRLPSLVTSALGRGADAVLSDRAVSSELTIRRYWTPRDDASRRLRGSCPLLHQFATRTSGRRNRAAVESVYIAIPIQLTVAMSIITIIGAIATWTSAILVELKRRKRVIEISIDQSGRR